MKQYDYRLAQRYHAVTSALSMLAMASPWEDTDEAGVAVRRSLKHLTSALRVLNEEIGDLEPEEPGIEPDVPPSAWPLEPDGRPLAPVGHEFAGSLGLVMVAEDQMADLYPGGIVEPGVLGRIFEHQGETHRAIIAERRQKPKGTEVVPMAPRSQPFRFFSHEGAPGICVIIPPIGEPPYVLGIHLETQELPEGHMVDAFVPRAAIIDQNPGEDRQVSFVFTELNIDGAQDLLAGPATPPRMPTHRAEGELDPRLLPFRAAKFDGPVISFGPIVLRERPLVRRGSRARLCMVIRQETRTASPFSIAVWADLYLRPCDELAQAEE